MRQDPTSWLLVLIGTLNKSYCSKCKHGLFVRMFFRILSLELSKIWSKIQSGQLNWWHIRLVRQRSAVLITGKGERKRLQEYKSQFPTQIWILVTKINNKELEWLWHVACLYVSFRMKGYWNFVNESFTYSFGNL